MQTENDGRNDFDFLVGNWKMRHRRLKERLKGCTDWEEFEGTAVGKKLLNGLAHCDEVVMNRETGPNSWLHVAPLRCEFKRMEHLLGSRYERHSGRPDGWPVQRWRWRIFFAGSL